MTKPDVRNAIGTLTVAELLLSVGTLGAAGDDIVDLLKNALSKSIH
jgi:hypothetical protein